MFGPAGDKAFKSIRPLIARINDLEAEFQRLTDPGLQAKTVALRSQVGSGAELDALLPEAFANCREAVRRILGLRAFDVQLIGGVILHQGEIAEMATGEGKTLVAVFAAYLNSLTGKGVHVATMNDYLAKRDAEWMGRAYAALGITCGLVFPGQLPARRRAAYRADVTYSTFSELGFDYLRDNMRKAVEDLVQREHNYAIIDEADSVLIDEARTPLIISGPSQDKSERYVKINEIMSRVQAEHFDHDRENAAVTLTEAGHDFAENELRNVGFLNESENLYGSENEALMHHVMQALRAHKLFHRDQQYIVRERSVVLIDVSTGRMMPKRRLPSGLHQAVEAKEGLPIKPETETLASTTVQNYFRLYAKLAGMTGTAATDAEEFAAVYKLDVIQLPTNKKIVREDQEDKIYRAESEKHSAVMAAIGDAHHRGQPILVGTTSVEKSQELSSLLQNAGIRHSVLNAHHHERESEIIADAGRLGAVTIATNMAGRGTDIQLGGNLEFKLQRAMAAGPDLPPDMLRRRIEAEHAEEKSTVVAAGGLLVIGTERHGSRRIDNQLRGRSGRQGDPGRTQFILSLEDELIKQVEPDLLANAASGEKPVEAARYKQILDKAQMRAESRAFQVRKQLLRFDDVVNEQRKVVYGLRLDFMRSTDLSDIVRDLRDQFVDDLIGAHLPAGSFTEQWDEEGLAAACREELMLDLPIAAWMREGAIDAEDVRSRILNASDADIEKKTGILGPEMMRNFEKQILLQTIDTKWREHRAYLDQLRSMIGLRSYARRDPVLEYQTEALAQFEELIAALRREVTSGIAQLRPMTEDEQLLAMGRLAAQTNGSVE